MVVLSICQCFDIKPKQAVGHLSEGAKHLARIVLKGNKGDYRTVIGWHQELYAHSKRLARLLISEASDQCIQIFNFIKFGLYCKNVDVAEWCIRLYSKLSSDVCGSSHGKALYNWFISNDGGLDGWLYAYNKHEKLEGHALEFLMSICQGNMDTFLFGVLASKSKPYITYLNLLHDITEKILSSKMLKAKANSDNLLKIIAIKLISETSPDAELAYIKNKILVNLWIDMMELIDDGQDVSTNILNQLKKSTKDKHVSVCYFSYAMLFKLFSVFAEALKPYAPTIYKILAILIIEEPTKSEIRAYLIKNLINVFVAVPSIPVVIFFDPYLKLLSSTPDIFPCLCDFHAFNYIVSNPKFNPKYASSAFNLLTRLVYKGTLLSTPAAVLLEEFIGKQIKGNESIKNYSIKFTKLLITNYVDLKNNKSQQVKQQPKKKAQTQRETEYADNDINILLYTSFTSFLNKVLIAEEDFTLKEYLLECKTRLNKLDCKDIDKMLSLYPQELSVHDEEEQQVNEPEALAIPGSRAHSSSQNSKKEQIVLYNQKYNEKVKDGIEKAKKKLEERKRREEIKKDLNTMKEEKANKLVSKAKKTIIEQESMGAKAITSDVDEYEFIIIDIQNEEENDCKAISLFMARYSKSLHFLFDKYSTTSYATKPDNFSKLKERASSIAPVEIFKLLKDNGVACVTIQEIQSIIKQILMNTENPIAKALQYKQFKNFFIQIAVYVGKKLGIDGLPIVESLTHIMKTIIASFKLRKEKAIILETPEYAAVCDHEVLKELTKSIAQKPNTMLPEGFYKAEIKQMKYMYTIPNELPIKTSIRECVQILDSILENALSTHLIEARAFVETEIKVLPKKINVQTPKNNRLGISLSVSQLPDGNLIKKDQQKKSRIPLSANMKVLILKTKQDLKPLYESCAYVLEEILFTIENGEGDIAKSTRFLDPQIKNEHLKKRLDAIKIEEKELLKKEKKRLERHGEIKKIVGEKAKKEENEKKSTNDKKKEETKKAKEEAKKRSEDIQKKLEDKKKAKGEILKKKEEEKKVKDEQESKKKKEENDKKKQERIDFLSKQKKDLATYIEEKKKKEKPEEAIENKEDYEKLYSTNKERETALKKDKEITYNKFKQFISTPQVQQIYEQYNTQLQALFENIFKLENYHIDRRMLDQPDALQLKSFIKFCTIYSIIPFIASTEEATLIFRKLTKPQKQIDKAEDESKHHDLLLNYEQFKVSMMQLSIIGKEPLTTQKLHIKSNVSIKDLFNIEGVSADILKKLIDYIGITLDDDRASILSKFTSKREEDTTQKKKPTKLTLDEKESIEKANAISPKKTLHPASTKAHKQNNPSAIKAKKHGEPAKDTKTPDRSKESSDKPKEVKSPEPPKDMHSPNPASLSPQPTNLSPQALPPVVQNASQSNNQAGIVNK